jgi:hypothetical protein
VCVGGCICVGFLIVFSLCSDALCVVLGVLGDISSIALALILVRVCVCIECVWGRVSRPKAP